MQGRRKLLFFIPAIILIPILLGMTPLNMAHRLASGEPCPHSKQTNLNNHCPFNSLTSHNDLAVAILNSALLDQRSSSSREFLASISDSLHSNVFFYSVPLRC